MVESVGYKQVPIPLFKASNDLLIDNLLLLARTAEINSTLGNQLGVRLDIILAAIQKHDSKYSDDSKKQEVLFELYHYLFYFRDFTRELFHGSAVGTILDKSYHFRLFLELGAKIVAIVGMTSVVAEQWNIWTKEC